jgi:hypothetical protein
MAPVKGAAVSAAPVWLDRDETIAKVVTLTEKAAAEPTVDTSSHPAVIET